MVFGQFCLKISVPSYLIFLTIFIYLFIKGWRSHWKVQHALLWLKDFKFQCMGVTLMGTVNGTGWLIRMWIKYCRINGPHSVLILKIYSSSSSNYPIFTDAGQHIERVTWWGTFLVDTACMLSALGFTGTVEFSMFIEEMSNRYDRN